MKGRRIFALVIGIFLILLMAETLPVCGQPASSLAQSPKPAGEKIPVLIATGLPTWTSYAVAVGVADIENKNTNLDVTVRTTDGSMAIIQLLVNGKIDIGFGASEYEWAMPFNAELDFEGKPPAKNLRTVLPIMPLYRSIEVPASRGIKTIADMKGKTISWNTATSMALAAALLEANGLKLDTDVVRVMVKGHESAVAEIVARRSDAMFSSVLMPVIRQMAESVGPICPLPIDEDKWKLIQKNTPSSTRGTVITKVQPGWQAHLTTNKDHPILLSMTSIISRADVSEDMIYTFVQAMLNKQEKIRTLAADLAEFGPSTIQTPSELPFHNGAIKALKEAGIWNDALEKAHQERLKYALSK